MQDGFPLRMENSGLDRLIFRYLQDIKDKEQRNALKH